MKKYFVSFLALLVLGSCSTGDTAMSKMMGGGSNALVFHGSKAVSEDEIEFTFSRSVTVKYLSLKPDISVVSVDNGRTVRVKLEQIPAPGSLITADLLVEDERRNTINVLVTLRSRNNRMPDLVINELCTEYTSSTGRTEFIEFKMRSAGNLGAMRVFIIGNSNASRQTVYEFSPAEVRNGDYVVLHLRTLDANAAVVPREYRIPGNTKLFHKTAMVYVMDQDDRILNAVMISENPEQPWPKDYFAETADFLIAEGAWNGKAALSTGTTATRTICRDETKTNTNSAADWYVTVTSGATPGGQNNTRRY
ncbi:MAG: hypothetical protein FWD28_07415 [Treponema sp.]|nr:hypothetical protein [Treponema sp.]